MFFKGDPILTKDIISLINRKFKELEQNLIYLKQVSYGISKENIKEDIIKYWGIERGIQICIEIVLDIANIIISYSDCHRPSSYRETILSLSELGVIPNSFAKELAKMVGFRNILVHDYVKEDEDIIVDILSNRLEDFIKYMNYINNWIKENYDK